MRKCPLSYLTVEGSYHLPALRRLHPRLQELLPLSFTSKQLRSEASQRADKLSIQGVQPKLSARLDLKKQTFALVDRMGRFILKPQHPDYEQVPENEDLTMKFAGLCGIEVPDHGLVYTQDRELTYWVRRFDRTGRSEKLSQEDFAQLLGESRDTKYRSSMEKVAEVLERFATFPRVEAVKLLRAVLFCYLCGNEDQHLKNFSLLSKNNLVQLSPFYDLLSTTILLKNPENPEEEMALPLRGKKNRLKLSDFSSYAQERLSLTEPVIETVMRDLARGLAAWPALLERSFLDPPSRAKYRELVRGRLERLGFRLFALQAPQAERLKQAGLTRGAGGHQSFFGKVHKQQHENWFSLTPGQVQLVNKRRDGQGGWQSAYRLLADDK